MANSKFGELYETYKKLVCTDPSVVSTVETALTWSSYFLAKKVSNSPLMSESIYSISTLITLFNDYAIRDYYHLANNRSGSERLKLYMTILQHCEVFIELAFRKKWNANGKWTAATIIQIIKCAVGLLLVHAYQDSPVKNPPLPFMIRKNLSELNDVNDNVSPGFLLQSSGRSIRRVKGSPPVSFRNWQPLDTEQYNNSKGKMNTRLVRLAETLHVMRPVVHLAMVSCFGTNSWKQWAVPLAIDLTSLHLYQEQRKHLPEDKAIELSRRRLGLLLYVLRNPLYQKYSRDIITKLLTATGKKIPVTNFICVLLLQYLNHWQDIYFYTWMS